MPVKTCFQWLNHSQRRLCIRIASVMAECCGHDSVTLDPVLPSMADTPPERLEQIKRDLNPWLLKLRDSPGFHRHMQGLSEQSFAVYPELCGHWLSSGALLYDISEPMSASVVQDLLSNSEPAYWASLVGGILDLPVRGCLFLSLGRRAASHGWRGVMVSWVKLSNGDLRLRLVSETIEGKETHLETRSLRYREGDLKMSTFARVNQVNQMDLAGPDEALEACWEPITDNQGYYSMCLAMLYLLQNRIITTSKKQKRRKKGTRRKGSSGSVSVTERTCKLDLDRWGRIVRRREKGRSGASQGTGAPRGPYQGPAKRVERYDRDMWVREANVEAHEEWLDLKKAADGTCLVRVNRACNEAGYTIGCETEVNHTRATISFTESLTTICDVNK
tara:strand:- start:304 stop:1473 length:1170 start_codon:yes stop_codon:yes gene_type:complete